MGSEDSEAAKDAYRGGESGRAKGVIEKAGADNR